MLKYGEKEENTYCIEYVVILQTICAISVACFAYACILSKIHMLEVYNTLCKFFNNLSTIMFGLGE